MMNDCRMVSTCIKCNAMVYRYIQYIHVSSDDVRYVARVTLFMDNENVKTVGPGHWANCCLPVIERYVPRHCWISHYS